MKHRGEPPHDDEGRWAVAHSVSDVWIVVIVVFVLIAFSFVMAGK